MFLSRFLPPVNRAMRTLDRAFFKKTIPVTAARIFDATQVHTIKEKILKDLIPFERFNQRYDFNSKLDIETPLLILRPEVQYDDLSTVSKPTQECVRSKILELVPYDLKLEYGDWTYEEIMKAVLPEDVKPLDINNLPRIGPLLHLDAPEPLQEYKRLIAEVICDKERDVQTVFGDPEEEGEATKLGFVNEVLAGPQNYHVELSHQGSSFTFHLNNAKFRDAYFDTKLAAERKRLVDSFKLGQAVADVYTGVGALGVAAAKRGAIVFANAHEEHVYDLLIENRRNNKVKKTLYPKNQSPTKFVQQIVKRLFEKTVDHTTYKKNKLGRLIKNPLKKGDKNLPACISHFVFSDPDQSLHHLNCLKGIYKRREKLLVKDGGYWKVDFPLIHVYAYHEAPKEKKEDAVNDLLQTIGEKVGHNLGQEFLKESHFVKEGPINNLYCITFKLPPPVAFNITEEELQQKYLEMVDIEASKKAAMPKREAIEPGKIRVTRSYIPSRSPEANRYRPSGKPPPTEDGGEEALEPTPFPGAPTQIASSLASPPTNMPAYSSPRVTAPQRTMGYTPLTSFQPRDAGSMAQREPQGPPVDRPLMDRGPPTAPAPGLIRTDAELLKDFARIYKAPKGLPSWKLKIHRKEVRAVWMAKQKRNQQELAYITHGNFNQAQQNNNEQGPGNWGNTRGERRFHSNNSPTQPGYGPHGSAEGVAGSVNGYNTREETSPPRPLIRFHIAANKTPKGGPMIRWHQVDSHPKSAE
ncbi:hypothetical protein L873DRAFT_1737323 [Choiromyces venosus 120613-1]|uniref:SAM-dependent methyltransferase TRM5/TYW2-type domain-containing protein n=1 Tax=Choiromyces venosus 120613-1 TaxID=1336337 RepID=A0A3N4JSL2_9PEZI|nr:hypothetical protein L873DRAFT_1737323 [Choiromyces venosus 120613-1]